MNKYSLLFILFTLGVFFLCKESPAQNIGINATGNSPDDAAMLDIDVSDKGLLIPRVALTGTSDATTIVGSEEESLLIYNAQNISDVTKGFYYWDGISKWIALLSEDVDSTNEYNTSFALNTAKDPLLLTDGGGTFKVAMTSGMSSSGCKLQDSIFTFSGGPVYTFVVPADVNVIYVSAQGGGGGGGASGFGNPYKGAGGGGGSGEYYKYYPVSVTPGQSITVTIGVKGTGAVIGGAIAVNGGTTSFGALVIAGGGVRGGNGSAHATQAGLTSGGSGGKGAGILNDDANATPRIGAGIGGYGANQFSQAGSGGRPTMELDNYFLGCGGGGGGFAQCTSHGAPGGSTILYVGGGRQTGTFKGSRSTWCFGGGGGGASFFGNGGSGGNNTNGIAAAVTAWGAGGGGGATYNGFNNNAGFSGGDGAEGILMITY